MTADAIERGDLDAGEFPAQLQVARVEGVLGIEGDEVVQGLLDMARRAGLPADAPAPMLAAAVDFVLEGLYAQKKISRSDERGFHGTDAGRRPSQPDRRAPVLMPDDDDDENGGGGGRKKKRYYN